MAVGSRFIADITAKHYERVIGAHASGRLLDLGCGHVPLYETYRGLVTENICVDWENSIHGNQYLDKTADLNAPLPFEDSSFDTVLLTDVLEHLFNPADAMAEIARVLRVHGRLIGGVPFFYWIHEQPHDYYRYTEYALKRLCAGAGLCIVECEPYGGLPAVLADLTSKGLAVLPSPVGAFFRPFHTAFSTLCLNSRLGGYQRSAFPLGYVFAAEKREAAR